MLSSSSRRVSAINCASNLRGFRSAPGSETNSSISLFHNVIAADCFSKLELSLAARI
jgi:hypothetical protein